MSFSLPWIQPEFWKWVSTALIGQLHVICSSLNQSLSPERCDILIGQGRSHAHLWGWGGLRAAIWTEKMRSSPRKVRFYQK
jgi:hypothetical protein